MSQSAVLPDGRLHLHHGPIDCVIRAWGPPDEVRAAYRQATDAFAQILPDLSAELATLRRPLPSPPPVGRVARAMHKAVAPFADVFITPMAAVAGSVADHVLEALVQGRAVTRAFVNNGGDIAFHLQAGECLRAGLVTDPAAPALDGRFLLRAEHPSRGLATSGRACKGQGGRSFSLGIADSVSVLARTAAMADAAATIIANAVDLPLHPAIHRRPARDIDGASDLGDRLVTWEVGRLAPKEVETALDAGLRAAYRLHTNSETCMHTNGNTCHPTARPTALIDGAVLCLQGRMATIGCLAPFGPNALETA